jgi:hypothetical protein
MEPAFPDLLRGPLWHTTRPDRYRMITEAGAIVHNPALPDSERWKTGNGPEFYPYVRHLNGVSLFDFRGFDPDAYGQAHPMSSWRTFVPFCKDWEASIWIEIDEASVEGEYIDRERLLARWQAESAYQHTIMPRIEAAVIGRVPVSAFRRVLVSAANRSFERYG